MTNIVEFEIIHLDHSVTNHSFDRELKDSMRNYFKGLYERGQIIGWEILYPY